MEALFWLCLLAIVYPYAIYPLILVGWNRCAGRRLPESNASYQPTVSIILPVHNEASRIESKVRNLLEFDYPVERLQLIVIGDGCTDDSLSLASRAGGARAVVKPLAQRAGKAAALNAGLELATGEVVVFTDAGISVEPGALRKLVGHLDNPAVGCVSGEDYIEGGGTEGLYGRLELLLRREEAMLHSIAGASGCFYGQRRNVCRPFVAGMAPDFLSVLVTVQAGYRAISEPQAKGAMTATTSAKAEFHRKTRTYLRGLTALLGNAGLLNPIRYPAFSLILWSHKLMRWLGPVALVGCLFGAIVLRHKPIYQMLLALQLTCYSLAIIGIAAPASIGRLKIARVAAYFLIVNAAAAHALLLWMAGVRQELWEPTRRPG